MDSDRGMHSDLAAALDHTSLFAQYGIQPGSLTMRDARCLWKHFLQSEISSYNFRRVFQDGPSDNLASLLYLGACSHDAFSATDLEEASSAVQLLDDACVGVCTHLAQCVPPAARPSLTARSLSVCVALAEISVTLQQTRRSPSANLFMKYLTTLEPRLYEDVDWLDPGNEVIDPKNKLDWVAQVSGPF